MGDEDILKIAEEGMEDYLIVLEDWNAKRWNMVSWLKSYFGHKSRQRTVVIISGNANGKDEEN